MASAKRVPAPVKASSIPDKATKAAPKTPRASIERGKREVRLTTLLRLVKAFDLPPTELLDGLA